MSITGNSGNWVGQSTHTIGSGPVALGAVIEGYVSFSTLPNGLVWYTIVELNNREAGLGTLTNGLLTRTNIYATLNAGTYSESGVPLPLLGNAEVYCTLNATAFQELTAGLIKLDGIEDGATADQTPEEIKISYESNDDTNAYTDDEKAKLATVEENAAADQLASEVPYDNSTSGLTASEVQSAIDEVVLDTTTSDSFNVKKDSDVGSAIIPKGTTAERTDPVDSGLFRFNTETNEFEGHNDTEWGGIGGGGVPEFIPVSADFTFANKKAYALDMSDNTTKTATIPDGFPDGAWVAIKSEGWTDTQGVHFIVETITDEWEVVASAGIDDTTRSMIIGQNATVYLQKISGKWSVVDGIGEGDYSSRVEELQEQIDDNTTAITQIANPNLLINGDFSVWQRGTEFTANGSNIYTADRWIVEQAASVSRGINTPVPNESKTLYSLVVNKDAGQDTSISQRVEIPVPNRMQDLYNGNTYTLSFEVYPNGITDIGEMYLQSGVQVQNISQRGSKPLVQSAWNKVEVTFTVAFEGQLGEYFEIRIDPLDTDAGAVSISAMKLEIGEKATTFIADDPATNLVKCYRYYEVVPVGMTNASTGAGQNYGGLFNMTAKRDTPTLTASGFAYTSSNAVSLQARGVTGILAYSASTAANTNCNFYGYVLASAEL